MAPYEVHRHDDPPGWTTWADYDTDHCIRRKGTEDATTLLTSSDSGTAQAGHGHAAGGHAAAHAAAHAVAHVHAAQAREYLPGMKRAGDFLGRDAEEAVGACGEQVAAQHEMLDEAQLD